MSTHEKKRRTTGRLYETQFDPETTVDPCVEIVEAIEQYYGVAHTDIDFILAESIDPDGLTALYRHQQSDQSWMISFDHGGLEISLWSDGRIQIQPTHSTTSLQTK